jgi:hypothetical protein
MTHVSPAAQSAEDEHSWKPPMQGDAAHAIFTPPPPPPPKPPKAAQQTSPFVQSAELEQDCVTPGIPVSNAVVASSPPAPELDPLLEVDPELDPPPELDEFNPPPPSSPPGDPLVDPPHAAANAATQLPTKRSLSILMEWTSCLNGPRRYVCAHPISESVRRR